MNIKILLAIIVTCIITILKRNERIQELETKVELGHSRIYKGLKLNQAYRERINFLTNTIKTLWKT